VLGVVAIAACLPVLARRVGAPVDRALWLVLCCPLVPVHLIGGGHNDALTVAFMLAGFTVLATPRPGWATLAAGGALLGLAVSIKITIGVVLPFAALLAVGGLRTAGWSGLLRRGGVVVGAALAVLVAGSFASGLGLGWLTALSGAGESVNWSSPPTAVGLAVEAAGRWFGADLQVVPAVRAVALVLLAVSLLVIFWRFRDRDPLVGAGLALLAVIFFAPITQPWYLIWPLALFAVGTARARWLAGTIVVAMATILPDGTGVFRPLGVPLSFAMIVLIGWVLHRAVVWLRGRELVAA
jgi:alpha-1,6-mannosyltransferase